MRLGTPSEDWWSLWRHPFAMRGLPASRVPSVLALPRATKLSWCIRRSSPSPHTGKAVIVWTATVGEVGTCLWTQFLVNCAQPMRTPGESLGLLQELTALDPKCLHLVLVHLP